MGGSQDTSGGNQGTTAEAEAVDKESHLVRNGIGRHLSTTDDSGAGQILGLHGIDGFKIYVVWNELRQVKLKESSVKL